MNDKDSKLIYEAYVTENIEMTDRETKALQGAGMMPEVVVMRHSSEYVEDIENYHSGPVHDSWYDHGATDELDSDEVGVLALISSEGARVLFIDLNDFKLNTSPFHDTRVVEGVFSGLKGSMSEPAQEMSMQEIEQVKKHMMDDPKTINQLNDLRRQLEDERYEDEQDAMIDRYGDDEY